MSSNATTAAPTGTKISNGLPKGWRIITLPEIGELSRGKSKHRPRNEPKLYGGPYPFIQTGDIRESGGTIRNHTQTYSELGLTQSRLWPAGTMCITIAANIGETGILTYPACFPDSVVGFRFDGDAATVRFIELFFRIAKTELERLAPATAQKNINVDILSKLPIPFPPTVEQRRIVAEIEKQFTRLEAGVAALRRVQVNLKRYRAAVLKAACEGKLVPTEAELTAKNAKSTNKNDGPLSASSALFAVKNPGYETGAELLARILAERRKNWAGRGQYKEPAAPDTANLPLLPEGWTWATVQQLNLANRPCAYGVLQPGEDVPDGVPFVRVGDINNGKVELANMKRISPAIAAQYPRTKLQGGELAITLVGAIGRTAIIPDSLAGGNTARAVGIIPLTKEVNAHWVEIWFRNPAKNAEMDSKSHEVARKTLNLEDVRVASVALPPLAEQTRIVAEVERRLSVVEELESVVSANLQRASNLRQSILKKAFAGELIKPEPAVDIAKIIPPLKPEHINRPNRHFARALLSAEIVHRLHNEPTFGRIKHQKIFHLCEHIAQIMEIEGQYHREIAGPLDNKLIYANEAELKKQQWYQEVHRNSYGHAYQPLAKAGNHRKYLEGYWPDKLPVIEKLIELMRSWETDRCEIFCTTYAAWNDLILWGKEPTEENILHEILERWHESKKRFPADRWRKAIAWMSEKGLAPTGFGKPTAKVE